MVKKALITGATGKIGREVCLELARAGYDIALHFHRSEDAAHKLADEISEMERRVGVFMADLSKANECSDLVKSVGDVDAFVHCASAFERTPFGEVTAEKFDEVIATEMRPAFLLVQTIGKNMREKGGSIVCFSDVAAEKPYANYLPYCMAKAGIDAMIKTIAKELAPDVRVNAIALERVAQSQKAASFVREVIESTRTGEIICIP